MSTGERTQPQCILLCVYLFGEGMGFTQDLIYGWIAFLVATEIILSVFYFLLTMLVLHVFIIK